MSIRLSPRTRPSPSLRPSPADLVDRFGSPLYVVDLDRVRSAYRDFVDAFRPARSGLTVAYSCKTNPLGAILRTLRAEGAEVEVVSGTEYARARAAGFPGPRIVFNGPVKRRPELERAVADGALVQADGAGEVELLAGLVDGDRRPRVGLRIAAEAGDRFGIPAERVAELAVEADRRGLAVESLSLHLPSVLVDFELLGESLGRAIRQRWPKPPAPYSAAAALLARLARRLRVRGVTIARLDLGGGLPAAPELGPYVAAIEGALASERWEGEPPALALEPGRALVQHAVDLYLSVVADKRLPDGSRAVVVDGGTSLLPGVHLGWPDIEALHRGEGKTSARVLGPLCLAADIIHPAARLPALAAGSLLAARRVGAYHLPQSSQFGGPRPAVVGLDHGRAFLARRAETTEDLLAAEDLGEVASPELEEART